jgi:hypothetical protein
VWLALTTVMALEASTVAAEGPVTFAEREIRTAARGASPVVEFVIAADRLGPQSYRIERRGDRDWRVVGGDAVGAMHGGLAHMYSVTNPPFIAPLLENIQPGLKTWLTVRDDDIYSFRSGDPGNP